MSLNTFTTTRKNSILAAVIIAAAFWFSPSASAATIHSQTTIDYSYVIDNGFRTMAVQYLGAVSGTARYVKFKIDPFASIKFYLNFCTLNSGSLYDNNCIQNPGPGLTITADADGYAIADLGGDIELSYLSPGRPYAALSLGEWYVNSALPRIYGSNTVSFAGGNIYSSAGSFTSLYFEVADSGGFVTAPTASMTFSVPADLQTLADFSNWQLNVDVPVLEEFYRIDVNYSTTIGGQTFAYKDVSYTFGGTLLKLVPKNYVLTSGNWTALAEIIVDSTEEVVASDQIDFTITIPAASGDPLPPSVTCEGGNWVSDNFCRVLRFLFVPSAGSLNLFTGLFTPLGDKIPFSYFGELKTAISGLNSSATPAFTLEPPQTMLDNIFTPFKVAFTWLLWLIFGFWLFRRLSHLEL